MYTTMDAVEARVEGGSKVSYGVKLEGFKVGVNQRMSALHP